MRNEINSGPFFVRLIVSLLLLLTARPGWTEVTVHGFLQGNYGANTATANPDGRDSKLAEERAQVRLEADMSPVRFFLKTDLAWDHLDEEEDLELREGVADYTASAWDLRIGRQIVTWGLGDLVFINDVFPKDYEAFFVGRPLEYLKKGVDAAKIGIYPDVASFEIIAIPFFTPNHFPSAARFWMFDPMPTIANRETEEPDASIDNTELAFRAYRDLYGFDASLYFYRGFFREPAMQPDNPGAPTKLTLIYPKLSVYGASLQGNALDGVLSLEVGYYDAREDRDGDDPMLKNSQIRFLLGYQRQPWEDFTVGVQYYGEVMADYDEYERTLLSSGFPKERRVRQLATVRLTQLLFHQTLRLSFFAFHGLADQDYLLNPEVKYNVTDAVWIVVGGNVFGGGKPWSQFGQFARDDNIYTQLRYEF